MITVRISKPTITARVQQPHLQVRLRRLDIGAGGLPGEKGDKGDKGDQGIQGIPGATTGDLNFAMDFNVSTVVDVPHNLGKRPAVTVMDSTGDEVEVEVEYIDLNNVRLILAGEFSGRVICN